MVKMLEETNRSLQASLLAYHASHPVVSQVVAKTLAERAEEMVAAPGETMPEANLGGINMDTELV